MKHERQAVIPRSADLITVIAYMRTATHVYEMPVIPASTKQINNHLHATMRVFSHNYLSFRCMNKNVTQIGNHRNVLRFCDDIVVNRKCNPRSLKSVNK